MTPLQKFTLEFPLKVTPKLLFTLISTSEGLGRWFADKVTVHEDEYHFEWEGSFQSAKLLEFKDPEFVRFEWTDDFHQGFMLEMQITHEPVSGESGLVVSDYAEPGDLEFTQMWWNTQVGRLQRLFNN
ncbi:MAG: START-like domain-containing protein [Bacteroidales bacterium]